MPSTHTEVYEIHRSFSDTEFGDKLADNVRYDKYRPDHILKKEWTELLGADVNNLTHMPLTYGLARAFINHTRVHQSDLMNESEEKLLLIAALSHDWAESITTDISFGDKTVLDDEEEQAAFERYLVSFYQGKDFELVDQARREIVFDHDSKLGEILNAIERIGYLRTALRADQLLRNGVGDSELQQGLQWLVFDVLSNLQSKEAPDQPPRLLELRKYYPVAAYIESLKDRIEAAFDTAITHMEEVLPRYGDTADQKRRQMECSVRNWDMFVTTRPTLK